MNIPVNGSRRTSFRGAEHIKAAKCKKTLVRNHASKMKRRPAPARGAQHSCILPIPQQSFCTFPPERRWRHLSCSRKQRECGGEERCRRNLIALRYAPGIPSCSFHSSTSRRRAPALRNQWWTPASPPTISPFHTSASLSLQEPLLYLLQSTPVQESYATVLQRSIIS